MIEFLPPPSVGRLILHADTAADLMTPNPVSVRRDATVREAAAFLTDRGFTGAPVINAAGRPVGVVTLTDLRGRAGPGSARRPNGSDVGGTDPTPVADVMTPGVLAVTTDTPVGRVVAEMLALKVHRVFVVDGGGVLVGVVSLFDLLRHLRP